MILTMNRHAATALMLAACPLSASADQPQKQTPDQRPNIVVIVTDDHSYQTLGTCEKDSPMPYPNFRKLADEGMVFDRSYCANPVRTFAGLYLHWPPLPYERVPLQRTCGSL